jgi:hypothetical protein
VKGGYSSRAADKILGSYMRPPHFDSGAASLARASRGIASGPDGIGGRGCFRLGNTFFGVSLYDFRHPSPNKCRCRGQTFPAGDSEMCGSGGRTECVSCAVRVRGRGDDGVGVCGPQVQISLITSDSVRFSTF